DCAVDCRLKSGCVAAAASAGVSRAAANSKITVRRRNEYFSVRVEYMAGEHLQGVAHGQWKTLDLKESLVNGCDHEFPGWSGMDGPASDGAVYYLSNKNRVTRHSASFVAFLPVRRRNSDRRCSWQRRRPGKRCT